MSKPRNDPRHCKTKFLILELFKNLLEFWVCFDCDEVDEFVEDLDCLAEGKEEGISQIGSGYAMGNVICHVRAENTNEDGYNIVESLKVFETGLVFGEGVEYNE